MAMPRPRSAALLISLYLDETGGAASYALLRAFDDPAVSDSIVQRATDRDDILQGVGRWLDAVLPPRTPRPAGPPGDAGAAR
jgi:hypothetical protein